MKNFKRIAAMTAALTLASCAIAPMSMTSFAADKTEVAISSTDAVDHTYKAFQIFTGTFDATNGLTVTDWATGYDSAGLLTDNDFTDLVTVPSSSTDAKVVAKAIEDAKIATKSADADKLAAVIAKHVGTSTAKTFTTKKAELAAGYWVITDEYTPSNHSNDSVSKPILLVSGAETLPAVETKKDAPTVMKKVKENVKRDDATADAGMGETEKEWNDVADYDITDSVPFKLYGTMPSNIDDYEHYYYKFTDTLGKEFTVDKDTVFTIKVDGTEVKANKFNIHVTTTSQDNGTVIEIAIEDVKALGAEITATSVITVEYEAVLNKNAAIGLPGQQNKVYLTYSNNPNVEYNPTTDKATSNDSDTEADTPIKPESPDKPNEKEVPKTPEKTNEDGSTTPEKEETDSTPEDKVIVFTYELDINKKDSTGAILEGVKFTVQNAKGEYATVNGDIFAGWSEDEVKLSTDANGKIVIKGLDDAEYTITETDPLESYSNINALKGVISADTKNDQNWTIDKEAGDALGEFTFTLTGDTHAEGSVSGYAAVADITNDKGLTLPTTGGIGTRLFVLGGGCAAALAGIYLISKKRVDAE